MIWVSEGGRLMFDTTQDWCTLMGSWRRVYKHDAQLIETCKMVARDLNVGREHVANIRRRLGQLLSIGIRLWGDRRSESFDYLPKHVDRQMLKQHAKELGFEVITFAENRHVVPPPGRDLSPEEKAEMLKRLEARNERIDWDALNAKVVGLQKEARERSAQLRAMKKAQKKAGHR